ncbi:MAG: FtsX-like permease family protein, partial [Tepidisphaeraceae bacterium]
MLLPKLAISNFRVRKVRTALTLSAIALSVSLVVAVTSGYASVEAAAFKFLNQYMGSTDAQVSRSGAGQAGGIAEDIVARIGQDPDVQAAVGRLETETTMIGADGKPIIGRSVQVVGVRRPLDRRVESMQQVAGTWFNEPTGDVAVLDQVAARVIKDPEHAHTGEDAPSLAVGDSFTLPFPRGRLDLKVAGIVRKPALLAMAIQTIYVPIETLQNITLPDEPARVTRVLIDLKPGIDADAFAKRWSERLIAIDPQLQLRLASDTRSEMDKNLQGIQVMSYLGGAVSMVAATFIVFSALSMGVAERQRTLAMLRAVGAYRSQLGWLVVIEGLALALLGVAVGVPLGWFWIKTLSVVPRFELAFSAGVMLSTGGVMFAAVGSLLAALAASLLPALTAMRLSPLEAMAPLAHKSSARVPLVCAAVGALLACVDPLLMFGPWERWVEALGLARLFGAPAYDVARALQFYGHFALGLPCVMVGFFLTAPLFVFVIERVAGPVVSAMFGLPRAMLRQQLSGGVWRAAGTCAALMVGLAILVVLQTQGHTMLRGWKLPDKFPDIFIVAPPLGALNAEQQRNLAAVKGIKEVMPIAVASPGLGSGFWAIAGAAVMPDATMFFGVDPDRAFEMMDLDFRVGNTDEARELLKKGRHVIITEEFRQLKGLTKGHTLALKTPLKGVVEYTVAGVVWSPGMDVFNARFDMNRQLDQRTAASVFGSMEDARRDFGVTRVNFFAANLEYHVEKQQVLKDVQAAVGQMGMAAGDVRQIKKAIQDGLGNLLLLVSTVAFAAMAVASLGVTNTIMASIRSRRWQFGILRSVGVTRGQLLRLVLAEALLLGFVGIGLGLVAGFAMTINARGFSRNVAGYVPPLYVPWGIIFAGMGIVLAI